MPELSRFYGIIVRMYLEDKEHNPPHIHAKYGSKAATINITTGDVITGDLPPNAQSLVKKWVLLHSEEIKDVWNKQEFKKIKPLE